MSPGSPAQRAGPVETPIVSLGARAYRIPTDHPEGDGTLAWDSTTLVLVEARAGDRLGTGWTYCPAAAAGLIDELLAPAVTGADALTPATVQQAMLHSARNAGRPGLVAMAISAVDIALWDLCARLHELPLTRLWGAAAAKVQVYGSGGFTTYDDETLRTQLDGWTELGLRQVKIKIGESWGTETTRDLQRAELARRTIGDDTELFVDANGAYSVGLATRTGRALDGLGVSWFEEPVTSDDLTGMRRVRESVDADVTAGEYGYDVPYFEQMAAADAVDCLQVDVTRCGGYTAWLAVSAVAAAHHLDLSGHCAPYLALPVAAATPHLRHLEWFHDHVRIEQSLFDGTPDPIDSCLTPNDAPGHGLTLRRGTVEDLRVA
jgi:L-alanine-DL-glutamate epimerase-like enolase superfamily enzyme